MFLTKNGREKTKHKRKEKVRKFEYFLMIINYLFTYYKLISKKGFNFQLIPIIFYSLSFLILKSWKIFALIFSFFHGSFPL